MSLTVERLPELPIVSVIFHPDYEYHKEGLEFAERSMRLLDQQSEQVFFVLDLRQATFSFDDIIAGASLVTRQMTLLKHPNIRQVIIITDNPMLIFASKGLNSPVFGNVNLIDFKSVDEAIQHVQAAVQSID